MQLDIRKKIGKDQQREIVRRVKQRKAPYDTTVNEEDKVFAKAMGIEQYKEYKEGKPPYHRPATRAVKNLWLTLEDKELIARGRDYIEFYIEKSREPPKDDDC